MSKLYGSDKRKLGIDFILEIQDQLNHPKQATIFDDKRMLLAKKEMRDVLIIRLNQLIQAPKEALNQEGENLVNYIQQQQENRVLWGRVVWSWKPGQPSTLGNVLQRIKKAFGPNLAPAPSENGGTAAKLK